MRENNARNTESPSMQLQLQLGKCSHLTAENSRIRGFEGFQGFEWRLHFEGAFNISFRAAMRCFYYLCTADTATKLSRYPPLPLATLTQVAGRRTLRQSVAISRFIVKWFQMQCSERGREDVAGQNVCVAAL